MYPTRNGPAGPNGWGAGDDRDYEVRVRGTSYLWGSAGITQDFDFPAPLLLHLGNDVLGEEISISTKTAGGTAAAIGTIQAGEYVTIPVQNISGVFATCAFESTVQCSIRKS